MLEGEFEQVRSEGVVMPREVMSADEAESPGLSKARSGVPEEQQGEGDV